MGIQERRDREKEQRKSAILECALNVFLKKGIDSATMDEIAECAELSKATLYLYFKNKEEIIFNVMGSVLQTFIGYLEEQMSEGKTSVEKIIKVGEAYLKFYRECHGQYLLLNSQDSSSHMDFSDAEFYTEALKQSNRLWQIICEPIEGAILSGYFKSGTNAIELATTLWAASNGMLNLMNHVELSHAAPAMKGYEAKDNYLAQMNSLDFEKMLRKLWESITNSYRN